ncbi:hypothetical protein HK104_000490 [Borealophlyctis nickersoniae]|nr:hypothetical protein HK104_000490 [Borealophlyctis nickersoniae]
MKESGMLQNPLLPKVLNSIEGGKEELAKIEEQIVTFNDKAVMLEDLDALHTEMKTLLNTCFGILDQFDPKRIAPALQRYDLTIEEVYQTCETFVMENTYEMVYFRISSAHRAQDLIVSEAVANVQNLDLSQMGLMPELGVNLSAAVKEFQSISTLRTPFEKIKCLMRSVHILNATLVPSNSASGLQIGKGLMLSSDVLIPMLMLMVIRSNVLNLESNIFYMKNYVFEHDVIAGEYGYAISSVEAVMAYLASNHTTLAETSRRNEAYWKAIQEGDLSAVRRFFEESARSPKSPNDEPKTPVSPTTNDVIKARNWDGDGALHMAVQFEQLAVVKYLIGERMDLDSPNYRGQTPLHICAIQGFTDIADLLLSKGASVSIHDCNGDTPLLLAAQLDNLEIASRIIANQARQFPNGLSAILDAQNNTGNTPLHYASLPLAELLISHSADANIRNSEGLTPLLHHAQAGNVSIAAYLVTSGAADVSASDLGRRTCLHLCCFRGYADVVSAVLESGKADVGAMTLRGNTPLHAASDAGHLEIVRMVLQAGADPTVKNMQGKAAADLAKNEDVRGVLDDYTLFMQRPFKANERVAWVVRAVLEGENRLFVVKSGLFPDISSITTVRRTLQDFDFLRQQLLTEFPEACLPDLRDLFTTPHTLANARATAALTSRFLRRIVKRLNKFVHYLLSHPVFATHELVWEFLVVPEIEAMVYDEPYLLFKTDMIIARTKSKCDYLLESIYDNYAPMVENLDAVNGEFKMAEETLNVMQNGAKAVGIAARKVGKGRKDLANQLRILRYHIGRPTSVLFESKILIGEVLRTMCDVLSKQSISDILDMGDFFLESMHVIAGAKNVLHRHEQVAGDYLAAVRQEASLAGMMARLEAQAKTAQTEEKVRKLSEYHAQEINRALTDYVHRQIDLETESLAILEKTLDALDKDDILSMPGAGIDGGDGRDSWDSKEELGMSRRGSVASLAFPQATGDAGSLTFPPLETDESPMTPLTAPFWVAEGLAAEKRE